MCPPKNQPHILWDIWSQWYIIAWPIHLHWVQKTSVFNDLNGQLLSDSQQTNSALLKISKTCRLVTDPRMRLMRQAKKPQYNDWYSWVWISIKTMMIEFWHVLMMSAFERIPILSNCPVRKAKTDLYQIRTFKNRPCLLCRVVSHHVLSFLLVYHCLFWLKWTWQLMISRHISKRCSCVQICTWTSSYMNSHWRLMIGYRWISSTDWRTLRSLYAGGPFFCAMLLLKDNKLLKKCNFRLYLQIFMAWILLSQLGLALETWWDVSQFCIFFDTQL